MNTPSPSPPSPLGCQTPLLLNPHKQHVALANDTSIIIIINDKKKIKNKTTHLLLLLFVVVVVVVDSETCSILDLFFVHTKI